MRSGCGGAAMAAFAPIPCVSQTGKTETLCLAWSNDLTAPMLAVSGKGSSIKVFNDDGDQQEGYDSVKRASDAVIIAWHPKNKVLAMGWRDGAISVCAEPGRVPQEDTLVHTSCITLLTWSPDGSRLLTGDQNGMMGIWKVDKRCRLTPICQYAKQVSRGGCLAARAAFVPLSALCPLALACSHCASHALRPPAVPTLPPPPHPRLAGRGPSRPSPLRTRRHGRTRAQTSSSAGRKARCRLAPPPSPPAVPPQNDRTRHRYSVGPALQL